MKIELHRVEEPFHFELKNENNVTVHIDASPEIGGHNAGVRPMELLLMALAGCSSIDVIMILNKQRQQVKEYHVTVDGERETGQDANVFKKIHIHFSISGEVAADKLQRAIALSLEKYCSVAKTLAHTAQITSSFEINP